MNVGLYYRMLKHDPDGRLVKDTGLVPSGSYVIQFLELLRMLLDASSLLKATDVDGVESYIYAGAQAMNTQGRIKAPALSDTYGIVVGTGDTAEDNEDYKLDTKILHDAAGAAGKMNYRDVTFVAPRVVGINVDFDVSRPFINETVATITVKEIGIICQQTFLNDFHLLLRDVVTDEPVDAGETLTVVYVLRTTV